jgi:hypothetical protein
MVGWTGSRVVRFVTSGVGYQPLECDGSIDNDAAQRRPRSRAASASAVVIGALPSASLKNFAKALRVFASSSGRLIRFASANPARRRNALRVSPTLRAAASIAWRSISGRETSTLRTTSIIPEIFSCEIDSRRVVTRPSHGLPARRADAPSSAFGTFSPADAGAKGARGEASRENR